MSADLSSMRAGERRERMLAALMVQGSVQVEALARDFNVSRMTIHRDLDELEAEGILRKVRGGATVEPSVLFESNYSYRAQRNAAVKSDLARAVAETIEPGSALMLDDSTTVAAMLDHLPARTPYTIITNARAVIDRLRNRPEIDLIALGGTYSPAFDAFVGLVTERAIAGLAADVLVMSAASVLEGAVYAHGEPLVRAKRAMMAATRRRVLVFDHGKIGKSALHRLASLEEFDDVMVDDGLSRADRELFESRGVPLRTLHTRGRVR